MRKEHARASSIESHRDWYIAPRPTSIKDAVWEKGMDDCERGQRYCSARCSRIARRESLHGAGRRYQQSLRGRHRHAKRQEKYRLQCREDQQNVTHQGSDEAPCSASLFPAQQRNRGLDPSVASERTEKTRCHFCQRQVSPLARRGWRRGS